MTVLGESLPFLAFAFSAGVGTFFAPCAYPLLPGYVSYYLGETGGRTAADGGVAGPGTGTVSRTVAAGLDGLLPAGYADRLVRAAVVGSFVSLGFLLVYGVIAGTTAVVGSRFFRNVALLEPVVGAVLVVVGSATALGYDLPTPTVRLPERRRSATGFVGFGVLYAVAAAGCTGSLFVGIALNAVAAGPVVAGATFAAYTAGMSLVMIGVTVAAAFGRDALLSRVSARAATIERVMGVLLVVAGVAQLSYFVVVLDGARLLGA